MAPWMPPLPASSSSPLPLPSPSAEPETLPSPDTDSDSDASHQPKMLQTVLPFVFIVGIIILVALAVLLTSITLSRRAISTLREASQTEGSQQSRTEVDTSTLHTFAALIPVKAYKDLPAASGSGGDVVLTGDGDDKKLSTETCVICLDQLMPKSPVRCLPCRHVFHSACIDQWFLKGHFTCPICVQTYYNPHP